MELKTPTQFEWQDFDFLQSYLYDAIRHNLTQETLNSCEQILSFHDMNTPCPQDLTNTIRRGLRASLNRTSTFKLLGHANHAREIAINKTARMVRIGSDLFFVTGDYPIAKQILNLVASEALWDTLHPLDDENTPSEEHGLSIYRDALFVLKGQYWWLWLKAVSGWEYWIENGRYLGWPDPKPSEHSAKAFQVRENGLIRCHEKCPPMAQMNALNERVELRFDLDYNQ